MKQCAAFVGHAVIEIGLWTEPWIIYDAHLALPDHPEQMSFHVRLWEPGNMSKARSCEDFHGDVADDPLRKRARGDQGFVDARIICFGDQGHVSRLVNLLLLSSLINSANQTA